MGGRVGGCHIVECARSLAHTALPPWHTPAHPHALQIVDHFLGSALKDEVMKIMPVQKQTRAGQVAP